MLAAPPVHPGLPDRVGAPSRGDPPLLLVERSPFRSVAAPLKPVLLERKILPKVWGGRALEQVLGVPLPPGKNVGETWELFDRADGSSRIRGGGATLAELMQEDAAALLGSGVRPGHGGRFPLLIKYIDARDALSVQVHPDDRQARAENDGGKHEAWVVLHAGPEARIVRGLQPGVTRERFASVAHTAEVEGLLRSFRPEVGDCIDVPAGTVHAMGPDVVVFEVQQNSDVTYRLYDWGRDREVHVDKALAVARLEDGAPAAGRPVVAPRALGNGQELLLQNASFRVRRLTCAGPVTMPVGGTFQVVNVLAGRCMLGWHSGGEDAPLMLQPGDTALLPACIEQVFVSPIGQLQMLWTGPGEGAR